MTSWRLVNEEKLFKSVGNNIKPALTAANQYERFQWALSWIDERSVARHCENGKGDLVYQDLMDVVMIDEKNFFKDKVKRRVILTSKEAQPHRYVGHKSHIDKVMFLCAQARPRHDPHRKSTWDGKLSMIPIGKYTKALKNSVHFKKGERKWLNQTVDTEIYLDLMKEVILDIAKKWPRGQWSDPNFKVKIQHDGAPAHTSGQFKRRWHMMLAQMFVDGYLPTVDKIVLWKQPPNSPGTNICDLGLFNALQASYWRSSPRNCIEIIECVQAAWKKYPWQRINHLFITLQMVFNEIVAHHGGNEFNAPHLGKFKLERSNELPVSLIVDPTAMSFLLAMDDPDFERPDEFVDDDLPLPGAVSKAELQWLIEDGQESSDEETDENSPPDGTSTGKKGPTN